MDTILLFEDVRVVKVVPKPNYLLVITDHGHFRAKVVVSADGISETDRVWLVEDLGPVMWVVDVFGSPSTRELVNTNVPEPGTIHLLALGLASLCESRRRSRSQPRRTPRARPRRG